mgnify:CR=1 FL=1
MGFWNILLKYGGKAAKGVGTAAAETAKQPGMQCCIQREHYERPGKL